MGREAENNCIKMTTGTGDKFCLRWNDFENNISNSFKELKDDKDFFDVTLACNGQQLQAHKVILSACSPFFRSVLKANPHPHPLLYLKGVQYEEILSVLNFMYHGEVNVAQEDLNAFLAVAEDLAVKGLTQNNNSETNAKQPEPSILKTGDQLLSSQHKIQSSLDVENIKRKKEIQDHVPRIKTEAPVILDDCITEPEVSHEVVENSQYQESQDEYGYEQHYQESSLVYQEEEEMMNTAQGWNFSKQFSCYECGKSYSNKKALQNHRNSHKGLTFCEVCSKHFSTVSNLRAHMNIHQKF